MKFSTRKAQQWWGTQEILQNVMTHCGDGIIAADMNERIMFINKALCKMLGCSEDDLVGEDLSVVFPTEGDFLTAAGGKVSISADDIKKQNEQSNELLTKDKLTYTYYFICKDGTVIPVENTTSLIRNDHGAVTGSISICRDITARKKTEGEIKAAGDFMENVFRTTGDGIYVTGSDGYIVRANRAVTAMLGATEEEIIGKHPAEFSPFDFTIGNNPIIIERLLSEGFVENFESEWKRMDGSILPVEMNIFVLKDDEGNLSGGVCAARDITARKEAEKELLKAKRLESIAALAGGVARDFNNILSAILGNINIACNTVAPGDKIIEPLEKAERAALRAKDLTRQLLTFSKGEDAQKKTILIGGLLEETAAFALKGSKVRCEFSLPDTLWAVDVDESQMKQVINNLLINADYAMPEGGTIRVSAENAVIGPQDNLTLPDGNYIKITLKDQSVGILNEHVQHIFNPYFSSRQKGSGLGLATTYSIIKNHNGLITIESEFGAGTTFYIYLPASQAKKS